MQRKPAARHARLGPPVLAMSLAVLVLLWGPAPAARGAVADPSAGWHGRAIEDPQPRPRLGKTTWPAGWSAGSVGSGTGYARPGGSQRVREVQRRLGRLGYRPGPVDGLFGPRTRAATRWFQFKHGLKTTGRVDQSALTVLRARSEHRPLGTEQPREPAAETPAPPGPPPLAAPEAPTASDGGPVIPVVALLFIALILGLVAGLIAPDLRRRRKALEPVPVPEPEPKPAPTPARAPFRAQRPAVLGYALAAGGPPAVDIATAAIAVRCSRAGWRLDEVVHDEDAAPLPDRAGLMYAVWKLRTGAASGLVVARLADITPQVAELATLLKSLSEADAFLAAADHDLDTSTHVGRATARAVIELGAWESRRSSWNANGRFVSRNGPAQAELGMQIAAMEQRGISRHSIADALNLAGVPTPPGHEHWDTADVKEVRRQS